MLRKCVSGLTLALRCWNVTLVLVLCGVLWPLGSSAKGPETAVLMQMTTAELPQEGLVVYKQIHTGLPFTHSKDGSVFGNRERLLPLQTRGYYREYTVPTPRVKNRGARRIICGGKRLTLPDTCYYTADHYDSFRQIVP